MITAAVLFEDGTAVRAWKGERCIYNAYLWAHKNYYLGDEGFNLSKLPNWLEVKFYCMSEEEFNSLVKA